MLPAKHLLDRIFILYRERLAGSKLGQLFPYTIDTTHHHDFETIQEFGYIPMSRKWWGGWQVGKRVTCNARSSIGPINYYAYLAWNVYGYDHTGEHSIIYGNMPNKDSTTIEVLWSDGKVTQDQVTNSVFVISREGRHGVCEISEVGRNGRRLDYKIESSLLQTESTGSEAVLSICT